MRKYTLASHNARVEVDLRGYTDEIEAAVLSVMPNAKVAVTQDYYTVSPSPGKGDAIRIGRQISKTSLGQCCIHVPKLFNGEEL